MSKEQQAKDEELEKQVRRMIEEDPEVASKVRMATLLGMFNNMEHMKDEKQSVEQPASKQIDDVDNDMSQEELDNICQKLFGTDCDGAAAKMMEGVKEFIDDFEKLGKSKTSKKKKNRKRKD